MSLTVVAGAVALDAATGDPRALYARIPHPVTLMARTLMALEKRANRPTDTPGRRRALGAVVLAAYLTGWTGIASAAAYPLSGPLGTLVLIVLASTLLAGRDLIHHVNNVYKTIENTTNMDAARLTLSHIVGRDTSTLDASAICRAAIESLAENLSDGFVAPVFWFLVAGLPGLVCYKAINTADSRIGHRSDRFREFGWAAARLDDLVNWIPARITAGLIAFAAAEDGRMRASWETARRDAGKHLSPNAGWPEAAMAGALDIRLGGPRRYGDREVDGAWFGDGTDMAGASDLRRALRLAKRVWLGSVAIAALYLLFEILGDI